MKILKAILIIIVAIVVIVAIAGLILPSKVHVERTRVLKSQPEAIYNQVNDLKNWNNWMPWNKMDPNWKVTYGEKTAGPGANYSWSSTNRNVGEGKVTIGESKPNESVETLMDFGKNGTAAGNFTFNKTDEGTKVTWGFDCDLGSNPFKKTLATMGMKFMASSIFEQGLKSLDSSAAAAPTPPPATAIADSKVDSIATR